MEYGTWTVCLTDDPEQNRYEHAYLAYHLRHRDPALAGAVCWVGQVTEVELAVAKQWVDTYGE